MLTTYLCFAGLLSMLGLAAVKDVRERRIPNRLTAGLALLYPIYVLVSPVPIAWLAAVAVAVAVFAVGALLFARELIGGGDVKLIAAVSLWAGPELLAPFALVTALTGGVLGMSALWYHRWSGPIQAGLARFGLATVGAPTNPEAAETGATSADTTGVTLPYGVAIAAGGVAVVIELMKL
jgi:prepilin peptidase CpaA